jgi:hypothetical protein
MFKRVNPTSDERWNTNFSLRPPLDLVQSTDVVRFEPLLYDFFPSGQSKEKLGNSDDLSGNGPEWTRRMNYGKCRKGITYEELARKSCGENEYSKFHTLERCLKRFVPLVGIPPDSR